jgi:hypothetical protein
VHRAESGQDAPIWDIMMSANAHRTQHCGMIPEMQSQAGICHHAVTACTKRLSRHDAQNSKTRRSLHMMCQSYQTASAPHCDIDTHCGSPITADHLCGTVMVTV